MERLPNNDVAMQQTFNHNFRRKKDLYKILSMQRKA